jgi:hypothetical protein
MLGVFLVEALHELSIRLQRLHIAHQASQRENKEEKTPPDSMINTKLVSTGKIRN